MDKSIIYRWEIVHRGMLKQDKAKVLEELTPIVDEVRNMNFPFRPSDLFMTREGLEKQIDSATTEAFMIFYCQLEKEEI